ncbi:DUF6385 domain-containing protein [Paenibacillus sp. LHD-117]|uniref:DUF6385 domain-containing protein n=1 Tax=Paenibacillus sp. LHD-117 TaxID=3071412 RepID=UPI0027E072E9|nr:DUF6385 domain-containing protein [Paenibacillus sp. LHD-117]MDQ6422460.1 DUF6385 domain-containing protein [Paenibacillus sp. LHD-117]
METTDENKYLPVQDTSTKATYSYAVINKGNFPAVAKIQISPNARNYADDTEQPVDAGETVVLVPNRFLRYTRLAVRSERSDESTIVDVYFQSQEVK